MKKERDTTLESASETQQYLTNKFHGKEAIDKDDLASLVVKLVKQVDHLTNRLESNSRVTHIKEEHNTSAATIDLVSSNEDESRHDGSSSDTSSKRHNKQGKFESSAKNNVYHRNARQEYKPPRAPYRNARTPLRTPFYTKGKQIRDCSIRNWELGMKRQAKVERINSEVVEATADNLPKVLENMRSIGFGIIRNMKKCIDPSSYYMEGDSSDEEEGSSATRYTSVFQAQNMPDVAQAEFAHTPGGNGNKSTNVPKHDFLFEGVQINSKDYEFATRLSKPDPTDTSGRKPRQAMSQKGKALETYNTKYIGQMRDIIKGMFANEKSRPGYDPANPDNWIMAQNIVWGGTGHQHPHCDQAKAGSFSTDHIFPFVCIHGFALHEFAMWILPARKKREYGFPYRFPKNAMLFLRGDCIHAGAYSQLTRAHLEFWPTAAAGWTRSRHHYWATHESFSRWQEKKVVFLMPDLRTFPFALPHFSEEDENGNQDVTYPVEYTQELFPQLDDNYKLDKVKYAKPSAMPPAAMASVEANASKRLGDRLSRGTASKKKKTSH